MTCIGNGGVGQYEEEGDTRYMSADLLLPGPKDLTKVYIPIYLYIATHALNTHTGFLLKPIGLHGALGCMTCREPDPCESSDALFPIPHHHPTTEPLPPSISASMPQCDLFSLGITVYELILGRPLPPNGPEWTAIRQGQLGVPENELTMLLALLMAVRSSNYIHRAEFP